MRSKAQARLEEGWRVKGLPRYSQEAQGSSCHLAGHLLSFRQVRDFQTHWKILQFQ
jgi:hypothetical protein